MAIDGVAGSAAPGSKSPDVEMQVLQYVTTCPSAGSLVWCEAVGEPSLLMTPRVAAEGRGESRGKVSIVFIAFEY
ncbi:unnamed protein product [Calypogeia fissa]